MKRLVLKVVGSSKEKKKEMIKPPKCWICMDQGFVYYYKKENGIMYEMVARCTCVQGNKVGESIPYIHHTLVEDIARINFEEFQKKHPEEIKKLSTVS